MRSWMDVAGPLSGDGRVLRSRRGGRARAASLAGGGIRYLFRALSRELHSIERQGHSHGQPTLCGGAGAEACRNAYTSTSRAASSAAATMLEIQHGLTI